VELHCKRESCTVSQTRQVCGRCSPGLPSRQISARTSCVVLCLGNITLAL